MTHPVPAHQTLTERLRAYVARLRQLNRAKSAGQKTATGRPRHEPVAPRQIDAAAISQIIPISRDAKTILTTDISIHSLSSDESQDEPLWQHDNPKSSQMWDFLQRVNKRFNKSFQTYAELHEWTTEDTVGAWGEMWDFLGIRHSQPYIDVIEPGKQRTMWPRPTWFAGAKLNFAENLLYPMQSVHENDTAVIAATETSREEVTWKQLRQRVRRYQLGLKALGIGIDDRVAGCIANHIDAIAAMLAATSLGAIWTAISPDIGVVAALDRFTQVRPCVLFADQAVTYNGKLHPMLPKVEEIATSLPSLRAVVILKTVTDWELKFASPELEQKLLTVEQFASCLEANEAELDFVQLPAEHPVFIMFSSGTTGKPKSIVHGAIGTLMQHKKEHILQSDIRPGDRLFYFTTCMWMMWHWHVSGLASGITLVVYDGSPFYRGLDGPSVKDDLAMPKLIEELGITHFGTSAKYLSIFQQQSVFPREHGLALSNLKSIYSTGSPLAPATFRYVYKAFGPSINLGSISGGTDLISDFGTPSPLNPVYAGEIQVRGLGMAVQAWSADGEDISQTGRAGELVCTRPFPSQPVNFLGPNGSEKYRKSYFAKFPGVWAHGDFICINPSTGGLVMLGRSDGTLNPAGVRFGSAEIYNVLLQKFGHAIEDSLCVGQRRDGDMDEKVILFLKMQAGVECGAALISQIRSAVRSDLSPRHEPFAIDSCPEIPYTANSKKVELAVKQIISGASANISASVANAGCLDWYRQWATTH